MWAQRQTHLFKIGFGSSSGTCICGQGAPELTSSSAVWTVLFSVGGSNNPAWGDQKSQLESSLNMIS